MIDRRVPVRVQIKRLPEARGIEIPRRATDHSAGFDLQASLDGPLEIAAGQRVLVPTGLALAIPAGYEAQVRPRSGLALRHGLTLANTPGTIDADYRGEIGVILINLGELAVHIQPGDRIAQLVVQQLPEVAFETVDELPETDRGAGGFGHTGR